ncbi:hypothetical protein ACWDO7_22930 [Streptomyces sp. NPDC003656]
MSPRPKITQPHLLLAALDEAVRYPDRAVYRNELRNDGAAEARTVARNIMADSHTDDLRKPADVLPRMDGPLRRWIDRGPTTLVGDHQGEYERGNELVQKRVLSILNGNPKTITDLLRTARDRAVAHLDEMGVHRA